MKVRDFIVKIPALCGAKNADRIADLYGYVFDMELEGDRVFARNDVDLADFGNRSSYLWDMLYADEDADVDAIVQCHQIMEIIERSHYLDKHGEKHHAKRIDKLYSAVKADEATFPDIAEAMPVDVAVTLGGWNV
jgi:hypothetical protein